MPAGRTVIYLTNYVGPQLAAARRIESHSEAANRRIESVCRALDAGGYRVVLISAGWKRTSWRGRYYGARCEPGPAGLNCSYVSYFDWPVLNAVFCVLSTAAKVFGLVRRHPGSAVLFYNPTIQSAIPAMLARWFLGAPIFLQLEDGTHLIQRIGVIRRLTYLALLRVARRLVSGALLPSAVLEGYFAGVRTCVCRGCFAELGSGIATWNRSDGESLTFLFGSTLDEIRGVELLLGALDVLEVSGRLRGERVRFLISGKGPLEEWVRTRCESYRSVAVRFLGFLEREDHDRVLSKAHVGLALQKHDHPFSAACFPSKFMELLSAGKLVITTTVSDVGLVGVGRAILLERDDPQRLAELICLVFERPEEFFPLAARGNEWVQEVCSPGSAGRALRGLIG